MIPGRDLIIKCPICKKLYKKRSIVSGNTLGATYYSDCSYDAPMLPRFPYFVKCHNKKCGVFFKTDRSTIRNDRADFWGTKREAPWVRFMTISERLQAIEVGLCNSKRAQSADDLFNLRVELWRDCNRLFSGKRRMNFGEHFTLFFSDKSDDEHNADNITQEEYSDNCRSLIAA